MYLVANANPGNAPGDDFGGMALSGDNTIKKWFNSKTNADAFAKHLAGKHPGKMFAVMSIDTIFEAAQPKIMEKKITDTGEVVPK